MDPADCTAALSSCVLGYIKLQPRTLWPSGLRRWLKAPFRKGAGSSPTGVSLQFGELCVRPFSLFQALARPLAGMPSRLVGGAPAEVLELLRDQHGRFGRAV